MRSFEQLLYYLPTANVQCLTRAPVSNRNTMKNLCPYNCRISIDIQTPSTSKNNWLLSLSFTVLEKDWKSVFSGHVRDFSVAAQWKMTTSLWLAHMKIQLFPYPEMRLKKAKLIQRYGNCVYFNQCFKRDSISSSGSLNFLSVASASLFYLIWFFIFCWLDPLLQDPVLLFCNGVHTKLIVSLSWNHFNSTQSPKLLFSL